MSVPSLPPSLLSYDTVPLPQPGAGEGWQCQGFSATLGREPAPSSSIPGCQTQPSSQLHLPGVIPDPGGAVSPRQRMSSTLCRRGTPPMPGCGVSSCRSLWFGANLSKLVGPKGVSAGWGEMGLHPPAVPGVHEPLPLFCSSPLVLMLTGLLVLFALISIIFFVSGGSHFQDPLFCGESPLGCRD